jgi:hypothetical protein
MVKFLHLFLSWVDALFYPHEDKAYVLKLLVFFLVTTGVTIVYLILAFQMQNRNAFIVFFSMPVLYVCLFQGLSGVLNAYIYPNRDYPSIRGKYAIPLGFLYLFGFVGIILILLWVTGLIG